jgi:hypothetical protein
MEEQTNWRIWVAGYGDYPFEGTETQAQAHAERRRKADSEGTSVSLMWRVDMKPFGDFNSGQVENMALELDCWADFDQEAEENEE